MRVFVADAEPDVRAALRLMLNQEPGIVMVGEANRSHELASRIYAAQADLVLLDWELPGQPVADLIRALRARKVRQPFVIVLSVRPDRKAAALAAGADDFVSKTDPPERLRAALHRSMERR
jgi:DNA-binding NarL/FixJ family response regulator